MRGQQGMNRGNSRITRTMNEFPVQGRVAYLGPEGTYSHAAMQKFFGQQQAGQPVDDIPAVFSLVKEGECQFGLVPVENSSEGSVTQTLDCFSMHQLHICGEVMLRIEHCLLVNRETDPEEIRQIVSHQQSLGQCRHWLEDNFSHVDKLAVSSNAEAARTAASELGVAAIAGRSAAMIYGLDILHENIEDIHDNTTRFAVISRDKAWSPTGQDKTSLIISTKNEPGALFDALEPFKNHEVNLIRLESRPSRKEAWSYSFFVDIEGHNQDANIQGALGELSNHSLEFRVLGSYPAAQS